MTDKSKHNMKSFMTTWLTPSLLLGGIVYFAYYFGEFKTVSKTNQFDSPAQKEKTRQHIDSDYNEVKNYKLGEELKVMKTDLDTAFAFVNAKFKEDLEDKNHRIKSREARDSLGKANTKAIRIQDSLAAIRYNTIRTEQIEIQREQKILSNSTLLIIEKLDNLTND